MTGIAAGAWAGCRQASKERTRGRRGTKVARPLSAARGRADGWQYPFRRRGDHCPRQAAASQHATRHADALPGPNCGAQSAPQRATHNRGAAPAAFQDDARRAVRAIECGHRRTGSGNRPCRAISARAFPWATATRQHCARPIAAYPSPVVLNEPTSALDVSLRSLIILLLEALQKRLGSPAKC